MIISATMPVLMNCTPRTMSKAANCSSGLSPILFSVRQLEHGQISAEQRADAAHQEAGRTENIERPIEITQHEDHYNQVENDFECAADAVFAAAPAPRPIFDRDLGHAHAHLAGERRDEAMQLAIKLYAFGDVKVVGLQRATIIMQTDAGAARNDSVGN